MKTTGLVPLFYNPDVETACKIASACAEGGARVLEFTNRGDFAHRTFEELARFVRRENLDLCLGVGSVQDAGTAALYMQLGADFIVGPSFRKDVAVVANRRKVAWLPGCATLTEIGLAEEFGADIVKIFPGGVLGPAFVKAVSGPCPWTAIMPTGGVSPDRANLHAWFSAGVACVGMGSKLVTKEQVKSGAFVEISLAVRTVLRVISSIRESGN